METKRCTKCGETKDISSFRFKPKKGRYESHCKECQKIERKQYDEKHSRRISKRRKLYRIKNREHIDKIVRSWQKKHREHYLEYCRTYAYFYDSGLKRNAVNDDFFDIGGKYVKFRYAIRRAIDAKGEKRGTVGGNNVRSAG